MAFCRLGSRAGVGGVEHLAEGKRSPEASERSRFVPDAERALDPDGHAEFGPCRERAQPTWAPAERGIMYWVAARAVDNAETLTVSRVRVTLLGVFTIRHDGRKRGSVVPPSGQALVPTRHD